MERDIDGERSETVELENREPRFGSIFAARRVARTLFLGSAPAAGGSHPGIRGLDRARVLLGCLQPGQTSATYLDTLNRLADRLHYLSTSDDKALDTTRFWFDTRATLRREMEDRKTRFDEKKKEVREKITEALRRIASGVSMFDGTHIFTPHADVPDDSALRLVIFPLDKFYSTQEKRIAFDEVIEYFRFNGQKPRYRGNRLLFVVPEHAALSRLIDCTRTVLAWSSIVDDVKEGRLNIDRLQEDKAKKELRTAEEVLPRAVRECYKWLLCPVQLQPTDREVTIEAYPINTTGTSYGQEIDRICSDNELVISTWSPIHLRNKLTELYWKDGKTNVSAINFWEDCTRYLYLPRLKNKSVLEQAIIKGASSKDFFGTAYGCIGTDYQGFRYGDSNVQLDNTLLLIEPKESQRIQDIIDRAEEKAKTEAATSNQDTKKDSTSLTNKGTEGTSNTNSSNGSGNVTNPATPKTSSFHGSIDIAPSASKNAVTTTSGRDH